MAKRGGGLTGAARGGVGLLGGPSASEMGTVGNAHQLCGAALPDEETRPCAATHDGGHICADGEDARAGRRARRWGTERNPLVLMEAAAPAGGGQRGLRCRAADMRARLRVPIALAVCVMSAVSTLPGARGDSVSALPHAPLPSGMAGSEGKGKGLLSSLEALFKKNCELLGKLRVELNDFSDGLDSLRELACRADSKLKYAFGSNYVGASDSGSPYGTPAQETPQPSPAAPDLPVLRETSVDRDTSVSLRDTSVTSWRDTSVSQETRDASMTPGADQLPHDPYRERKGRQTSEITRGDLSTPLQLKNIRRTVSMDDIVLTEEDEMDLKPMDEVVCFLDLDKCTIYGQDGNDLAIAMQWMGRPGSSVVELYRRLMNPQIKPLMKQLHRSTKRTPVVLYTMRPQLLQAQILKSALLSAFA